MTPEQDEELKQVLADRARNAKIDEVKGIKQELKDEQMSSIRSRWRTKLFSLDLITSKFTDAEKVEKYSDVEETELKVWREDNYLIANTRGEFKDTLYGITKKLFKLRSVRIVNDNIEFTKTGNVNDGYAEQLSAEDYFIKSPIPRPFSDAADEVSLTHGEDIHSEPDEQTIENLADTEYLGHLREIDARKAPAKPTTMAEWAQIHAKAFRAEKAKSFELDALKEKLLKLDDEIKAIKKFHEERSKKLDSVLEERSHAFDELQTGLKEVKSFLSEQDLELAKLISKECESNEVKNIMEITSEPVSEFESLKDSGNSKKGFLYWFNRLRNGQRHADSDFF